jgi:hypothetical protein
MAPKSEYIMYETSYMAPNSERRPDGHKIRKKKIIMRILKNIRADAWVDGFHVNLLKPWNKELTNEPNVASPTKQPSYSIHHWIWRFQNALRRVARMTSMAIGMMMMLPPIATNPKHRLRLRHWHPFCIASSATCVSQSRAQSTHPCTPW